MQALLGESPDSCIQASTSVLLIDLEEILGLATEQVLEELSSLAPGDGSRLAVPIKSLAIVIVEDLALCATSTRCEIRFWESQATFTQQ